MVNLEYFKKIELRTAKILEAERIRDSDKLLKLQVTLGEEKRQIIAGIGLRYTPDELKGKIIIIVSNLKPKKFRIRHNEEIEELESQGMLLAVSDSQKGPILLTVDEDVEAGLMIS